MIEIFADKVLPETVKLWAVEFEPAQAENALRVPEVEMVGDACKV